jgi:hypothetical protein
VWVTEDSVRLEVDGSTVPDPDDGVQLTAVLVRMPAWFAEHLAEVLAAWTAIGEHVREFPGGEQDLATGLRSAVQVARRRDDASPELLRRRMRDLLAEHAMAEQAQRDKRGGQAVIE